jgi:hypothetical protein
MAGSWESIERTYNQIYYNIIPEHFGTKKKVMKMMLFLTCLMFIILVIIGII